MVDFGFRIAYIIESTAIVIKYVCLFIVYNVTSNFLLNKLR